MSDAKNSELSNNTPEMQESPSSASRRKAITMAMKVNEETAESFRKMAKETGMEQGTFLQAMIENFRLNEDKTLYKEHADDTHDPS